MGKKKLNITGVRNELEASAFFSPPVAKKSPAESSPRAQAQAPPVAAREQTMQRTKVRHTFDVFADQVTALKRIQLERKETSDERHRMGDLVQEALDAFFANQSSRH